MLVILYKGTIPINGAYLGTTPLYKVINNGATIVALNKERYKWLLQAVGKEIEHKHYVWNDNYEWDDDMIWTEDEPFIFSAFSPTGLELFDIDNIALFSDYNLLTTDVLYKVDDSENE